MPISGTLVADFDSFFSAVRKAEVELKGFETGATKVGASLNRMADSFSGRRVVQEATLMAEAIAKIGGVTKLTEAELAKAGRTATEAAAKMRLMGEAVPANMQAIVTASNNLTPALSGASTAAGVLQSTFAQFTAANLATQAINKVIAAVGEFVATGQKLPAVETAFRRLATSIGQDSGAMLASLTTATQGMVSSYDLMLSANKAVLLGLPVTAASFEELAGAATTLGRAMGKDATESINDMVTALGRSSPQILDNLGLTVDITDANKAYADSVRKAADELTDGDKKLAFYTAAMEAARAKTLELGERTKTFSEVSDTAWTKVGNQVSWSVGAVDVGIGKALTSWKRFADEFFRLGPSLAMELARIRNEGEQLGTVKLDPFIQGLGSTMAAAKAAAGATQEHNDALKLHYELVGRTNAAAAERKKALEDEAAAVDRAAKAYQDLVGRTKADLFGTDAITKAKLFSDAIGDVNNVAALSADTMAEVAETMQQAIDAYVRTGTPLDALTQRFSEIMLAAEEMARRSTAAIQAVSEEAKQAAADAAAVAADLRATLAGVGGNVVTSAQLNAGFRPPGSRVVTSDMLDAGYQVPGSRVTTTPPQVIVNAQNSFFNTPSDAARLAQTVGDAVMRSTR